MNQAGTILVPLTATTASSSTSPIVPLGALVGQLGYTMTWSSNRCKLEGRGGDVYNLRVREGCPEIAEHDALRLISRLEDGNLESLKANTAATRSRVRAAALSMERSWFDYLLSYVDGEMASEAWKAVESAPFFQEVPRQCKAGLVESFPEANGWRALQGLEHLNRRTRKRLWNSDKWLVHLFAGKKEKKDLHHLEAHGYMILELDIERGRTQDLLKTATWRAIEFGARKGKIAGIIGGPPQSSFMISRHVVGGPEPVRSNAAVYGNWPGQPDADTWLANRETQLLTRMIYLHALATAGRMRASPSVDAIKGVAFMLEHPRDPRGYLKYQDPLYNDVVSFWRTPLWTEYALEAGFNSYHFDMAAFGKAFSRHTTIGTNLPLKHLNGLRARWRSDEQAPERSPPSVWTSEFYEQVVIAMRTWGAIPKMIRMSADQWREHVRRADPDGRGAFPKQFKYIFVAKLKVPRTFVEDGRGVWIEYDDGELTPEKYEDVDDGLELEPKSPKEAIRPEGLDGEEDPDPAEEPVAKRDPEDDLDLAAPDLINLIFTAPLKDDKAPTVLEAIQDVALYCQSLNIPVLRFHSDRGMEFQARASKQWLKNQRIRVTSSEAGAHQTNGAAEATVRWAKQRVRALLLSAKLPQRLWPMALTTAATMQRADVLGFEPLLAAPFGAKVMVKKRQLEGPKLDDLAPKWLQGTYVGRSESLRKGHLVYINDEDGEKFVHTLHVRGALHDPGPVEEEFVAEEPAGPSVRVRGKSSGSGDVVGVAKATVLDEAEYQTRAEAILQAWSQEEAEVIVKQMVSSLPPSECVYGMFRYGGKTGVTKATIERPWFAKLLLRLLLDKAPDAEFAALFVSVRNDKEVHIDRNNAMGTLNYLLPIIMPRRGGDIWQELRAGFFSSILIVDMLHFHGPVTGTIVNINALSVRSVSYEQKILDDESDAQVGVDNVDEQPTAELDGSATQAAPGCEVWDQWDMRLAINSDGSTVEIEHPKDESSTRLCKAEVVFTENVEAILGALEGPLSVVYTVNPKEVALNFEAWVPALQKEISTLSHAVERVLAEDEQVNREVTSGEAQLIPMKIVFTVKPPDASAPGQTQYSLYKRKCRIVICGNLTSHQPGEVYTNTAPAEVVRAALAIARVRKWNLGILDVIAAFLQTPFAALKRAPLVYGVPPKLLVRAGLCQGGELWKLTHAVYGLQESPRLWGRYRDMQLAKIQIIFEGKRVTLLQGRVEPSWWSVLQEGSVLIGIIVVYVDDILICGHTAIIKEVAKAIRAVWKTNELQLVSDGMIRFLGIEISMCSQGFLLSQRAYIEELIRVHQLPATRKDIIPVSKDLAMFTAEPDEGIYSEGELRAAQQCPGLQARQGAVKGAVADGWQGVAESRRLEAIVAEKADRTGKGAHLSFVASLVGSLSTKAPRRAIQIAEKTIAFLQRTIDWSLVFEVEETGLCGYCDASFAPEGARSHGGWIVFYNGCVISWRSSRQATVTISTAESELTAIAEAVLALQSISSMMQDVLPGGEPVQLYSDSTSALSIANGSGSWRTRHLRLKSAWIAELVGSGAISISHCVGDLQIADLLTKALPSQRIKMLSRLLNLRNPGEDDEDEVSTAGHWDEEEALVVKANMSVDYGIVTWALLWGAVIVALLSWELLKWLLWIAYDRATPGAKARLEQRGRDSELAPTAGVFTPMPAPQTRVILRYVHEPAGEIFAVPGNEWFPGNQYKGELS
ncbi:RE2 [Symbiodinium sp. CCMP2592]|nr:RE2 [Symbiodinium sp. CCMP2592]